MALLSGLGYQAVTHEEKVIEPEPTKTWSLYGEE